MSKSKEYGLLISEAVDALRHAADSMRVDEYGTIASQLETLRAFDLRYLFEDERSALSAPAKLTPKEAQKALGEIVERLGNDDEDECGEGYCQSTSSENLKRIAVEAFQLGMRNK